MRDRASSKSRWRTVERRWHPPVDGDAVDVATGWVEMDVVWGKPQERVGAAIRRMQRRLPVPLLGLDSDNGSEFINHGLYAYCEDNGITFTRSRPYLPTARTSSRRTERWYVG